MATDLDVRQQQLSVTTTSSKVADMTMPSNRRKVLYFRNTSPNAADIITIALSSNAPAVDDVGIVLKQNDQYVETTSEGFEAWQGQVNAICKTANGKLTVLER